MRPASLSLSLTLGIASALTAHSQTPEKLSGASASSPSAAAPRDSGSAYQDKTIEGLQPLPDETSAAADYNPDGWVRQMRVETQLSRNSYSGVPGSSATGVAMYGLLETPNHGVLSADIQAGGNPGGGLFTLRQRGLPLDGGWLVSNELGVIGAPAPTITRLASRVAVPGYLLLGGSTEWLQPAEGLQVQGSAGSPGRLDGTLVGRFRRLPGSVTSLGGELDRGPWSLAARVADASGVSFYDDNPRPESLINARSAQFGLRYATQGQSLQANVVATQDDVLGKTPGGLWIDGESRSGATSYGGGVFYLEPGLSWAGVPMANDLAGVYVRSAWQTRQWSAEGTVDLLRSVALPSSTGVFASSSARWRYSSRISVGGGASVRRFNGSAWNAYSELRWQNDWGSTSLRAELINELELSRTRQLTLDHDWSLSGGWSLATSVTGGRATTFGRQETLLGMAASINAPISSSLSVRANASTESTGSGDAANSRSAINAGLSWRLAPQWSLETNYNLSKGRSRLNVPIDPLALPLPFDTTVSGSSVFVALRWETRAGSASGPLGGSRSEGGARIGGTVFFDANSNGRQEAGEAGAPGVTVYLDNRYAARTDGQGRYEFPFVGTGLRVVTVQTETLPLPWTAPAEGRAKVDIRVREDRQVDFGVVREGIR